MNSETRTFKRVEIEDATEADLIFTILMGDRVAPCCEFIKTNFIKKDNYMSSNSTSKQNCMNIQLVTTLIQIIRSLSQEERKLLEQELLFERSEPSTQELINLAQMGGSFDFLYDEPDIYTLEDGEPV